MSVCFGVQCLVFGGSSWCGFGVVCSIWGFWLVCLGVSVLALGGLEADARADVAGGAGAGLGQEEASVGADADLVHRLPGARGGGRGRGRGLPVQQTEQADPRGVQRDLTQRAEHRKVRGERRGEG